MFNSCYFFLIKNTQADLVITLVAPPWVPKASMNTRTLPALSRSQPGDSVGTHHRLGDPWTLQTLFIGSTKISVELACKVGSVSPLAGPRVTLTSGGTGPQTQTNLPVYLEVSWLRVSPAGFPALLCHRRPPFLPPSHLASSPGSRAQSPANLAWAF